MNTPIRRSVKQAQRRYSRTNVVGRFTAAVIWCLMPTAGQAASVTVAASNSLPTAKAKADLVCDGSNDQVELLKSITMAATFDVECDSSPNRKITVSALGRHSVEWLPGDYHLSGTLHIPDCADTVIDAEGTVFHYNKPTGDAVRIEGMFRCRYRFGAIRTVSSGVAINVFPDTKLPAQMSVLKFTGLVGKDRQGIGLKIDADKGIGVSTCRFEGTDVSGFDTGIHMSGGRGKADTNWFWMSYIRMCNTCIHAAGNPKHPRVDANMWFVNVDAVYEDSVAIRTSAKLDRWYVIMGTFKVEKKARAIVIEPGAADNVFDVQPPIKHFTWEDNSGNDTNKVISTRRPPLAMPR